jgi:hypothetical protein
MRPPRSTKKSPFRAAQCGSRLSRSRSTASFFECARPMSNVRFWHLADIPMRSADVRYRELSGSDADISGHGRCSLSQRSRPLYGRAFSPVSCRNVFMDHSGAREKGMKSLQRRQFLRLAGGAAALPVTLRVANAEVYPSRPVRLLVGFAPGGGTDVMTRLLQPTLSERLGQQIVSRAQVPISPPRLSWMQHPTVTRYWRLVLQMPAMQRFTTISSSTSSATAHRSRASRSILLCCR